MEKEMDEFLEKLKNAGMEINEEMAKIIQEERARIPEAASETLLPWKQKNQPIICRRSKAPVTRTLFFLSLLTIATASGFAGYLIGVNLCWRSIFNKEHIVYLLLGYGLKHFVKGRGEAKTVAEHGSIIRFNRQRFIDEQEKYDKEFAQIEEAARYAVSESHCLT
ncbi:hypothetical protein BDA96_02G036000 [Sorghum bicolor]|uniref:Uncharacterized protein n=2 Tax=Sorghum bicolor TaxID=4558 RepID=A0A1W0W267_SORBI|nr:hypothetical protein BDA96_02G036000 [Sorghum bicolor]OQU88443.1 hypothetical protein SORBI_3002G035766 [Sorghum bicolor]